MNNKDLAKIIIEGGEKETETATEYLNKLLLRLYTSPALIQSLVGAEAANDGTIELTFSAIPPQAIDAVTRSCPGQGVSVFRFKDRNGRNMNGIRIRLVKN